MKALILLLLVSSVYAQVRLPYYDGEKKLWGFVDENGEVAIPAKFNSVSTFNGDYCNVMTDAYGLINQNGEFVVPPNYGYCRHLTADLFVCYLKEKVLLRNRNTVLIDTHYTNIKHISENILALYENDDSYHLANYKGKRLSMTTQADDVYYDGDFIIVGFDEPRRKGVAPPFYKILDKYDFPKYTIADKHLIFWDGTQTLYVSLLGEIVFRSTVNVFALNNALAPQKKLFNASSSFTDEDIKHHGGWASSKNLPVEVAKDGKLSLQLKEEAGRFICTLSNGLADTVIFNASDSRMYLTMQIKLSDGSWRNLNPMPRTTCGNSYHHVKLKPGEGWVFSLHHYPGPSKAEIRVKLSANNMNKQNDMTDIPNPETYSNTLITTVGSEQYFYSD